MLYLDKHDDLEKFTFSRVRKDMNSDSDIKDCQSKYNPKNYDYDLEVKAVNIIFKLASVLQARKAKTYQGSWKKRGWQVSIFSNISRKFDRLESIFTDNDKFNQFVLNPNKDSQEEPILDTLIDLGVYSFLAAAEIMMSKPELFFDWLSRNNLNKN